MSEQKGNEDSFRDSFRIGIYVRESRDEQGENYETIETQRDLLLHFAEEKYKGNVYAIYIDDNVSGSGFDRDGIRQLKHDVQSGSVNLLLLKDLSRLGRNNAQTLLFLDYLEEYGVRVLTFDGRYDSNRDNDTVGIETWVNERYIRDISRKIRTNMHFKIQRGEYLGTAPYGYVKSPNIKNRLCIDEQKAVVVREMFDLYVEGTGCSEIARHLNAKGYAAPSGREGAKWCPAT
ncbi:MAG: recombinase family protein, partial [Eubacteriales bacterium]|nr:recombinase family protein [Eubacteriales bacterium]